MSIFKTNDGFVNGGGVEVTKNDVTEYKPPLRGLVVTGAGIVRIVHTDDSDVKVQCAAGIFMPIAGIKKVMSTDTTATGIVCWKG